MPMSMPSCATPYSAARRCIEPTFKSAPSSSARCRASRFHQRRLPGSMEYTARPSWGQLASTCRTTPMPLASANSHSTSTAKPCDRADFEGFVDYIAELQRGTIQAAEQLDGSGRRFLIDKWQRDPRDANAGWGATCVLEGGDLLEKAAVNITVVKGTLSAARAQAMSARGRADVDPAGGQAYAAAALSLVFHPAHPFVPTLRGDVRLFQVGGRAWYGGGCDLTPAYLFEEDAVDFHRYWKHLCDAHGPGLYRQYKAWCDRYFYLPARKERRGIGGIFFDDLPAVGAEDSDGGSDSREPAGGPREPAGGPREPAGGPRDAAAFTRVVGASLLPSWEPIATARRRMPFGQHHRDWQLLRRGRYLEFNLLYDRGVRFGLDGGRIESVMVSAPPLAAWRYDVQPGEWEQRSVEELTGEPREWA